MNKTSIILSVVLVLLVLGGFWYGTSHHNQVQGSASPVGTVSNDAHAANVTINLANPGANGTSTSLVNTDGNPRYITSVHAGCTGIGTSQTAYTGAGLASLQMTVGTTSTANSPTIPAQLPVASAFVLATGTVTTIMSSSTLAVGSQLSSLWPVNGNLDFWFNATNTATCTVGVDYLQS